MLSPTASQIKVRDFDAILSDEPPSREGDNLGPTPMEYVLVALCAGLNVATARAATGIGFIYEAMELDVEGELDTRGRLGLSDDIPVHLRSVRVSVRILTDESQERLSDLADLVSRHSAVWSLVRAAVPDLEINWESAQPS